MITDSEYVKILKEAGIISEDDRVTRVTIDCLPMEPVMIYIEKVADDRIVKLIGKLGETLKEV